MAVRVGRDKVELKTQERQGRGARLVESVLQHSAIEVLGGILGSGIGEICELIGGMRG